MEERDESTTTERPAQEREDAAPAPVGARRRTHRTKPEGLAPKLLRVTALFVVLGVVFAGVSYQRARGQLSESLLGAGAQMMMMSDAERQDAPRRMVLNGQHIEFSTGIAPYTVGELLDRFESQCEEIDAGLMERLSDALARHPDPEREAHAAGTPPVLRDENGGNGYVACLDMGRQTLQFEELLERYRAFERTRDLHAIGDLRYLYAQPIGDGSRSHFVAVWTDGSMRLGDIFPDDGSDVHGDDPADVPRPPGSRRVLSAYEVGDPQRATFYQTSELDQGHLSDFYRRELAASGWQLLASDDPRAQLPDGVDPALVAMRGGRIVWLAFTTDPDGRVNAAVIETGLGEGQDDLSPARG